MAPAATAPIEASHTKTRDAYPRAIRRRDIRDLEIDAQPRDGKGLWWRRLNIANDPTTLARKDKYARVGWRTVARVGLVLCLALLAALPPFALPAATADASATVVFADDFDDGAVDPDQWVDLSGGTETDSCGSHSVPYALRFGGGNARDATTRALDVSEGGLVRFWLRIGPGEWPCDRPEAGEGLVLEFYVPGSSGWTHLASYAPGTRTQFTMEEVVLPPQAKSDSTKFRWRQLAWDWGDSWAIDDVEILRGEPSTPGAPTELRADAGPSTGEATVRWKAPLSDGSAHVRAYRVYGGEASGEASLLAELPAGSATLEFNFTHSGQLNGVDLRFQVSALNVVGEGQLSVAANATTFGPPGPPGDCVATRGRAAGQIDIAWRAPASNGGFHVTGYVVYRSSSQGGTYVEVVSLGNVTAHTDTGRPAGAQAWYHVRARNDLGLGPPCPATGAMPPDVPGPPRNVSADRGRGPGEINLSWLRPEIDGGLAITGYAILRANVSNGAYVQVATVGNVTSWVDAGIPTGAERHYRVRARNDVGWGAQSSTAAGRAPDVPNPPVNVTVKQGPGAGQMEVRWIAPADDGGLAVTGYAVFRADASSGAFVEIARVGDVRTYVDQGLAAGATVYYRIEASNEIGESGPSEYEANVTFDAPGPPRSVVALTGSTAGSIRVQWDPPASDGGLAVASYAVLRANATSGPFAQVTSNVTATVFVDSGLNAGAQFYYRVRARNDAGLGVESDVAVGRAPEPPSPPASCTAQRGSAAGRIDVAWTTPSSDGGLTVNAYLVHRADPSGGSVLVGQVSGQARIFTDTGLPANATFLYSVRARNDAGDGTACIPPPTITHPPPQGGIILQTQPWLREVGLTWTVPGSSRPLLAFEIERAPSSSGPYSALAAVSASFTSHTDRGLENGARFYYRVRAISDAGPGPWSNVALGWTFDVPGPPRNLVAQPGGTAGQISLRWDPPTSDGGLAVSGYAILRSSTPGGPYAEVAAHGAWTDHTDTGRPAGTTWYYVVVAINAAGRGPASSEAAGTSPGLPGAPTSVSADSGPGRHEITIRWNPPATTGGSPLIRYWVWAGPDGANLTRWSSVLHTGSGTHYYAMKNLPDGAVRVFRVSANTSVGEGPASAPVTAAAPSLPGPPRDVAARVGAARYEPGRVEVSWEPPSDLGGVPVGTYQVWRSTVAGAEPAGPASVLAAETTSLRFDDFLLIPGVRYYYQVRAANVVGAGPSGQEAGARASLGWGDLDGDADGVPDGLEPQLCGRPHVAQLIQATSLTGRCATSYDYEPARSRDLLSDEEPTGVDAWQDEDEDYIDDRIEASLCDAEDSTNRRDGVCRGDDWGLPPYDEFDFVCLQDGRTKPGSQSSGVECAQDGR